MWERSPHIGASSLRPVLTGLVLVIQDGSLLQ